MELLTDRVFSTENSIKLMDLIYKAFFKDGNRSFKNYISYNEFKITIHKFIIDVMGLFLLDTKYSNDTYDVYIKKMNNRIGGKFCRDNNALFINESVILKIYNGDLESFLTIFHELNHFKLKYDILSGVVNLDTCRIVKEMLIMDDELNSSSYNNSFKTFKKNTSINNFYYYDNYKFFTEEVVANINSKFDLVAMMRRLLINYNLYRDTREDACSKLFNEIISDDYLNYENSIRDVSTCYYFNSNNIDFNEAFDILVKYHPEWLKYPQIGIEYYIDENNKVRKKSIEQLIESLDKYSDINTREYIEYLIRKLEKNKEKNNGRHK